MALTNEQYNLLMREYEERRRVNHILTEQRMDEIEKKIPALKAFDNRIATLSVKQAMSAIDGNDRQAEDIADEITMIRVRRRSELESFGINEDDLEPVYTCRECRDTGYVGRVDGIQKKCKCFIKRELEILYEQSGIKELLKKENFSKLSYEYCTGEDLTRLQSAVRICKEFIDNYGKKYRNLVFCGTVGTGKSYLACCIAYELIEKGFSVLYRNASQLFDAIAQYQFGYDREGKLEFSKELYDCDLLVIDDLGTELTNSFIASALFTIVSERHNRNHPTIITTNLSLQDMRDRYSERTLSRITGNYDFILLSGPDVRQLL